MEDVTHTPRLEQRATSVGEPTDNEIVAPFPDVDLGDAIGSPKVVVRPVTNVKAAAEAFDFAGYDLEKSETGALVVLQHWEGVVTEIDEANESFKAELRDISAGELHETEIAEFGFDEVQPRDFDILEEGAAFRWIIGKRRMPYGQRKLEYELLFRRRPRWTQKRIDAALKRGADLAAEIHWD